MNLGLQLKRNDSLTQQYPLIRLSNAILTDVKITNDCLPTRRYFAILITTPSNAVSAVNAVSAAGAAAAGNAFEVYGAVGSSYRRGQLHASDLPGAAGALRGRRHRAARQKQRGRQSGPDSARQAQPRALRRSQPALGMSLTHTYIVNRITEEGGRASCRRQLVADGVAQFVLWLVAEPIPTEGQLKMIRN